MSEGLVVVYCVVWLSGLRDWRLFGCELAIEIPVMDASCCFFPLKKNPSPSA